MQHEIESHCPHEEPCDIDRQEKTDERHVLRQRVYAMIRSISQQNHYDRKELLSLLGDVGKALHITDLPPRQAE